MKELKKIGHNIDLKNIVIHKIDKVKGIGNAVIKCNTNPLPVTGTEKYFIARVLESFQKKISPTYGTFDSDYPDFCNLLSNFKDEKDDFVEFTRKSMFLYKRIINVSPAATGAFLIFAHYINTSNNNTYFLIFAINNQRGFSLNDTLTIRNIMNIDLSKIDLTCRINISKWQEFIDNRLTHSKTYLAFVKGKKGISDYFMNQFIGCSNKQTNEVASANLVNAINGYCKYKGYDDTKTKEVKASALRHSMDRMTANQEILLDTLSAIINGDEPREFAEFASKEEYSVSQIISGHKKTLQNLQRIKYISSKLNIEFDTSLVDKSVFYDRETNVLRIEEVPEELANQFV